MVRAVVRSADSAPRSLGAESGPLLARARC